MIQYINTIDNFYELYDLCWSGAINTLDTIESLDKEDELMSLLDDMFSYNESCTLTDINDFLWFDSEYIYESLGLELTDDGEPIKPIKE